jgi:hypothetical protein
MPIRQLVKLEMILEFKEEGLRTRQLRIHLRVNEEEHKNIDILLPKLNET